jgi:hypothetical protein
MVDKPDCVCQRVGFGFIATGPSLAGPVQSPVHDSLAVPANLHERRIAVLRPTGHIRRTPTVTDEERAQTNFVAIARFDSHAVHCIPLSGK